MALLTISEQQALKPISANWEKAPKLTGGVSQFEQLTEEVQDLVLPKLLGYALYQDVVKNPTEARNLILLEGGTFTDCNGNDIDFKGLKFQLAYFNYERYVNVSNIADTASGMRAKNIPQSEPIRDGVIKREGAFANSKAMSDFNLMEMFLNENTDTYSLWVCTLKERNIPTANMINLRNTSL